MTVTLKEADGTPTPLKSAPISAEEVIYHAAAPVTSVLIDGNTALTPKYAVIDESSSGDNTLVAAVTSKKIRVLSLFLISAGTVTAKFQTATGGAYLSGPIPLVANGGFVLPYSPLGHMETVAGDLLNLELSGAVAVGGGLVYVEV